MFSDRFHDRILRTPREVRNALAYVLNNARRHGEKLVRAFDVFSSGPWFGGWKEAGMLRGEETERPTSRARTWLLAVGWLRHGEIGMGEVPGPATWLAGRPAWTPGDPAEDRLR